MLVDIVGNLARVELDVIGHGGELCRSAQICGGERVHILTTSRNTKSSADIMGGRGEED